MQITELVAIVRAKTTEFEAGLARCVRATDGLGAKFSAMAQSIDRVATRISATVGGLGIGITTATAKMGVDCLAMKENALIAFETLLGGADKAKKMMADLTAFAQKTPFELPGLIDQTQRLLAYGVAAEKVIPMLRVLGDTAAGLGGGDKLNRISLAVGQMISKGRIQAQEMLQLAESGVPAWQMLANVLGTNIPGAMKLVESGAVQTGMVLDGMLAQMDQCLGGLMDKQSTSWTGLWSNLIDVARQRAGFVFEPLFNAGKLVIDRLYNSISGGTFDRSLMQLRATVGGLSATFANLAVTNGPDIIRQAAEWLVQLANAGMGVVKYLQQQGPALIETAQQWGAFLKPIMQFVADHPELIAAFVAFKVTGLLGINDALGKSASLTVGLVQSFLSLATSAGGANTAMMALKGGGFAAALAVIAAMS